MSESAKIVYRLLVPLVAAAGLSAFLYIFLLADTRSINHRYKPVVVSQQHYGNLSVCHGTIATSPPVSMTASNTVQPNLDVPSVTSIFLSSTADWKIFQTFKSNNITTPQDVKRLSPEQCSKLEKVLSIAFPIASRAFKLCDSYQKSFNKCDYALLSDPGPCDRNLVSTIIVVPSLPQSASRRMGIRERLRNFRLAGYRLVFITGHSPASSENELRKEAATYGDIIWADFWEDYDNLTIKTIVMLRWVESNCLSARYVVKADDDVYLNMVNLEALLNTNSSRHRTVMGFIGFNEKPYSNMDSKWYMPAYMFDKDTYPPFAHGPCYVLTTDILQEVNRVALTLAYMHLEDIFLAVCISFLSEVSYANIPHYIAGSCSVTQAVACHGCACS